MQARVVEDDVDVGAGGEDPEEATEAKAAPKAVPTAKPAVSSPGQFACL